VSRGRKPKPAPLRLIEGNAGKRPIPKPVAAPADLPVAPAHLPAEAKAEWARIVPGLERMGLLSSVDRAALAAYCACWARWVKAETELQRLGADLVRTPNGAIIQSPWISIANRSLELMHKYLSEFGLSPVSRQRLSVKDAPDGGDKAEKYFA
jgi:P27 family predicted phage terminase small subunit